MGVEAGNVTPHRHPETILEKGAHTHRKKNRRQVGTVLPCAGSGILIFSLSQKGVCSQSHL